MELLKDPKVKLAVEHRALWLKNRCPGLLLEDAKQQMWLEAVKLAPKFCESFGSSFSTLLFSHLRFRAINYLKSSISKIKTETEWAEIHKYEKYDPMDEPIDILLGRIRLSLNSTDRKVLEQMINPSDKLKKICSAANSDLKKSKARVSNVHLAYFFHVSEMTISRSTRHIEKVFRQAVAGKPVNNKPKQV